MASPQLRYLSAVELDEYLPDVATRIELCGRAMTALAEGAAEMPPKIGVHPRPGALLHAMPGWLMDGDVVGLKWVAAYPNNQERGLPAISGLIVLNDPDSGVPTWIMDAARITAVRTAAVSGVGISLFRPSRVERVAILGTGVQARSHVEVLRHLLPDAELVLFDRHHDRAQALADEVGAAGGAASTSDSAQEAARSAQIVITAATMGASKQAMTPDWLSPGTLVVSVDFATYASADLARAASEFVTDDRDQFIAYRSAGHFDGYPDPTATLGGLISADRARDRPRAASDDNRPVLVNHLGVGLADVVFADAIVQRASAAGAGLELVR